MSSEVIEMHTKNEFPIQLGSDRVNIRLSQLFESQRHHWNVERHSNAEYEVHLILKGECLLEVEEKNYTLVEGSAVIIYPNYYHYPTVTSKEFERFSISFSVPRGILYDTLNAQNSPLLICKPIPELINICYSIYNEWNSLLSYSQTMLQSLFSVFMVSFFRHLDLSMPEKQSNHLIKEVSRAEIIDAFFNTNLAEPHIEDTLAKQLCISKRQLSRVMYLHYGMSFRKKLILTRMERAAWLLRTSDMRIQNIAEAVGYSSEASFFQVFKSYFEKTPHQYRKESWTQDEKHKHINNTDFGII
ncbi:MAG: helix-turn-helix domain-containing protein [Ruminococcaceae bacterium]|nr:helix-turn-helix domain-containing protein [Oscillospiraceae bacterium]